MKSLRGAGTPPHFGYRRNASREEHLGRGGRAILRPKPLFHAVDEEFESEEESEEEAAPLPSSLPIIKNNGQVYTYPDGKSGMGEYTSAQVNCLHLLHPFIFEGMF